MIKQLSSIITRIKGFCYDHAVVYGVLMGLIAAALLLFWANGDGESVAFVYNEF